MKDIYIPSESEKEIEETPLVFLEKEEYENAKQETVYYWRVKDENIDATYKLNDFGNEYIQNDTLIARIYKQINKKSKPDDIETYSYKIDVINKPDISDLNLIFKSALRSDLKTLNIKFNYCYLLWCLNNCHIDKYIFKNVIENHPQKERLKSIIKEISPCISISKQNLATSILNDYIVYNPKCLKEALFTKRPNIINFQNLTIFDKFDIIFNDLIYYTQENQEVIKNINKNEIIEIYNWLYNDKYKIDDYKIVTKWYSFMSHNIRLLIIKRYFHDIRNKLTIYNENIVKQFEENKYNKFQIFRHCLQMPKEAYALSAELLCNSIRVFIKSKGEKFQDIDEILDIAIQKSDIVQPKVDFKVEEILPICNGGAIYNENFSGFIKIENEYLLNPDTVDENRIKDYAKKLMSKIATRYEEFLCGDTVLQKEQVEKCKMLFEGKLTCLKKYICNDKWIIDTNNKDKIDFLKQFIDGLEIDMSLSKIVIEEKQINYGMLIKTICDLPYKKGEKNNTGYSFTNIKEPDQDILDLFYEVCCYKIYPNENAALVSDESNSNFIKSINGLNINLSKENIDEQKKKVSSIIIRSLEKELGQKPINGKYFEVDKEIKDSLIPIYYVKTYSKNNDFLTCKNNGKYYNLCAPSLSKTTHRILDLNHFWCKGKECFKNSLSNQVLEICSNYKSYTLFHITEILNYKLINITPIGNEPEKIIRNYVPQLMKAIKKYNRLRCKKCGHLLFANNEGTYNQHFYFSCRNNSCQERGKLVYLNYCYKCKKGLIDSRETLQCDNHWYICPSCVSCCDDNLIERLIQRDVTSKRTSKWIKMKGKGHNNKNIFFCPTCGTLLANINDNYYHCTQCNKQWRKDSGKNTLEMIHN